MKTFEEFMNEHSIAMKGDWEGGAKYISSITKEAIDEKYTPITSFKPSDRSDMLFDLMRKKHTAEFIVGVKEIIQEETKHGIIEKEKFNIVFIIQLSREKLLGSKLGNDKLYNVDGVHTIKDDVRFRRSGIAIWVYRYFVKTLGWNIMGDEKQYYGARKLWAKLSNQVDVIVDLIDIKTKKVIDSNITLHHGKADEEFDERLWDYEGDKSHIRPILRDIL